jgi:hypothetical protein
MKIGNLIKTTIANMDTISLAVSDSNFHKEKIKITHDEACRLVDSNLIYSHKVKVNSSGQHMTITVN